MVIDGHDSRAQIYRSFVVKKAERAIESAGSTIYAGDIADVIQRGADRTGNDMVGGCEGIAIIGRIGVGEVKDEGAVPTLLHVRDACDEGA